jgi:hypothetical protein
MRKRRFKKRGRSQQSRVYGFLALHTNFGELRHAEVRLRRISLLGKS